MLRQVWNKRSKKWVLYDDSVKGGIKDMSQEQFPGVPLKGEEVKNVKQEEVKQYQKSAGENTPEDPEPVEKTKDMDSGKNSWADIFDFG